MARAGKSRRAQHQSRDTTGSKWPEFEETFGVKWKPNLAMWRSLLASRTDGEFSNDEIIALTANGVPDRFDIAGSAVIDGLPVTIRLLMGGHRYNQKHRIAGYSLGGQKKIKPGPNAVAIIRAIQAGHDNDRIFASLGASVAKSVGNVRKVRSTYENGGYTI